MKTADEALQLLIEGNERFVQDIRESRGCLTTRRVQIAAAQTPFAIILGCSDSRVPAELVFDQGLGDLFVIRVAGNIVAPSQVGSVEFAVSQYNTPLVVVLGHSQCGAVTATVDEMLSGTPTPSRNIRSIVDRVRPSVASLMATDLINDRERLLDTAVRANVRASVAHLRHGSEFLESFIADKGLRIVGAEYDLKTGLVDFFDT